MASSSDMISPSALSKESATEGLSWMGYPSRSRPGEPYQSASRSLRVAECSEGSELLESLITGTWEFTVIKLARLKWVESLIVMLPAEAPGPEPELILTASGAEVRLITCEWREEPPDIAATLRSTGGPGSGASVGLSADLAPTLRAPWPRLGQLPSGVPCWAAAALSGPGLKEARPSDELLTKIRPGRPLSPALRPGRPAARVLGQGRPVPELAEPCRPPLITVQP